MAVHSVTNLHRIDEIIETSLLCSVAYRGTEIIFSTIKRNLVVGICARTRVMLQTLDLPSDSSSVVRIFSNPENGMVILALSDGTIQTYHPMKIAPRPEPNKVMSAFGRYRWINGPKASCREIFNLGNVNQPDIFTFNGQDCVDVSSSSDYRLLVAHHDQIAIFDATPLSDVSIETPIMDLLWTTKLDRTIDSARISGDGYAIVVVVVGEGVNNENPFGARTFIRDTEDGAEGDMSVLLVLEKPLKQVLRQASSGTAIGIVYKPGPFLVHTSAVCQISFRGFGHVTSSMHCEDDEGNDLLLTYCSGDNNVRIFSQNSWKQIMQWTAPPHTRVDWVRGISAFNLGDLESQKSRQKPCSTASSRRPSLTSAGDNSVAFNASVVASRHSQTSPAHPSPSSAGGAWIAELTFRSAFPALRLSRLSYMKRGSDDAQPAHFESVAAILPAGSVSSASVLGKGDMGLAIQGIWPAWHPWNSDSHDSDVNGPLSGSAMAFLGLNLGPQISHGYFGESNSGGTHSPPSELRIVASHPHTGKVVLMEFPLWGDQDFGAMELGSPLRYVLSLSDSAGTYLSDRTVNAGERNCHEAISLEYESSTLSARIEEGSKSVSIMWRKQGSVAVLPISRLSGKPDFDALLSSDPIKVSSAFGPAVGPALFQDITLIPVPLSLPLLWLPKSVDASGSEKVVALKWWPDENYGGPPQLLIVTASGSILLFEMPPLWSALEPAMPSYDPFQSPSHDGIPEAMSATSHLDYGYGDGDSDSDEEGVNDREYEVMITPDADFGIGLRLEAQLDGMPSIAGSFKKHPISGGKLPAERTGMISLGDELLSVNGVSLEGIPFDDIIGTVREVGSDTTPGEPLCIRFRPVVENRKRVSSMAYSLTGAESQTVGTGNVTKHQTFQTDLIEDIVGNTLSPKDDERAAVCASNTMKQEFSRIVAFIRGVVPQSKTPLEMERLQNKLVLAPWTSGLAAPAVNVGRGTALLILADGTRLISKLLEVAANCEPDQSYCDDLGSFDLSESDFTASDRQIMKIEVVNAGIDSWCISVCDNSGGVSLVFVDIEPKQAQSPHAGISLSKRGLHARFRHTKLLNSRLENGVLREFRPYSVELAVALIDHNSENSRITVWTSKPTPRAVSNDSHCGDESSLHYSVTALPSELVLHSEILDFRFIRLGPLDVFPMIAVFTTESVIAYRYSSASAVWQAAVEVVYSEVARSHFPKTVHRSTLKGNISSPADQFSHLASMIQNLCDASDEDDYIKSDWHADTMVSSLFTESFGASIALTRNVKPIYAWLARWVQENECNHPSFDLDLFHDVVPFRDFNGQMILQPPSISSEEIDFSSDNDTTLMASLTVSTLQQKSVSDEERNLAILQSILCPSRRLLTRSTANVNAGRSNEFKLAMVLGTIIDDDCKQEAKLPPPIRNLSVDELRLLWALGEIVTSPPSFKDLDKSAQLTLSCAALFCTLQKAKNDEETESGLIVNSGSSIRNINDQLHGSMRVKSTFSFYTVGPAVKPSIASSACISALTSNTQSQLIDACRPANDKYCWEQARSLRLPFWVRSDEQLLKLSEEVGQKEYRDTRDIMKSALFFVIVGNMRTLRNLAATDQSITGRAFFKFINSYDFSSIQGRSAAEKNAYSLLSKRKYIEAVSFFLLADPPMLNTAIECVLTKIGDLDLAFLILRMLELSKKKKYELSCSPGGLNLSTMMGGGGGYASGGRVIFTATPLDTTPFEKWKPILNAAAHDLLTYRGIPSASQDHCLIALQLMWLGRPEEASHHISGLSTDGEWFDMSMPRPFDRSTSVAASSSSLGFLQQESEPGSANRRVIMKCNDIINFSSRPLLVNLMESSPRSRWAVTLLVSEALKNRGLEILAARLVLQNTHHSEFEKTSKNDTASNEEHLALTTLAPINKSSSIVDSFNDMKSSPVPVSSIQHKSSIFDDYDVPKMQSRTTAGSTGHPQSSIFDNFDQGPPKTPSAIGASSIFDSFDVPKQGVKTSISICNPLQSTIFDSFDAPNSKTTSIVDCIDGPSQQKVPTSIDLLSSSIYGPAIAESIDGTRLTHLPDAKINNATDEVKVQQDFSAQQIPTSWLDWRDGILVVALARRLIRELEAHILHFPGAIRESSISEFFHNDRSLIPSVVSEMLRTPCNSDQIVSTVRFLVDDLCSSCKVDRSVVVQQALRLLDCNSQPSHVVLCVLLHSVTNRADLAEDIIRDAALRQIERCGEIGLSNDELVDTRRTVHHCASQHLRRLCVRVSWQLELCLWLQRGGNIPLSCLVLKEAIVAVRIGFVIACWGRNHACLETIIRCEPDCKRDQEYGRQLWSSMKMISGLDNRAPKKAPAAGSSSGGWEFLVDCRREEATNMLKKLAPGSFIIRPHNEDNGVFTLSFKTNLTPSTDPDEHQDMKDTETVDILCDEGKPPLPLPVKAVKKDDVVQHAIIRLSDAGFRCGSFGPFASLLKLLEAVSASLPFDLLFDKPPTEGIIKEEEEQPSPNGMFIQKFALSSHSEPLSWNVNGGLSSPGTITFKELPSRDNTADVTVGDSEQLKRLGIFSQLLTLTEIRKQLSGVVAAQYEDSHDVQTSGQGFALASDDHESVEPEDADVRTIMPTNSDIEENYAVAARILRPFLVWCRMLETRAVFDIAPAIKEISAEAVRRPVTLSASETAIELAPPSSGGCIDGGDAIIRNMIQLDSGVEFRTLRVGEGGDSAMIVLFSKRDAIKWLISSGTEKDMDDALVRLGRMEKGRVIEPIALSDLSLKAFINHSTRKKEDEYVCFRFVDPWEVEAVESREGETMGASLGRGHYFAFSISAIASSCEASFRKLGGIHLLGLWTNSKGGVKLTKAIASVHAPWERDSGGDLQMSEGTVTEPTPFFNSIRKHLYRNDLFRRLHMPQRFVTLVQVELLDLKNLNAPSGTSISVYALLRLKRPGSSAPLSHKARTLDSSSTPPVKIGKISHAGPNAPASWGSLVRFRFPLPEDVNCDGVSQDVDREALFKGPPSMLQILVYEKKFMSDIALGGADVRLDALATGGQIEEWVPLRSEKHGIQWFARIRLTLRFELMCLPSQEHDCTILPPSVGLRKIQHLSKMGGTHEDSKVKKSSSTPDLLSYFESMVY